MSSQSSSISSHFEDDQDETCSCATYSSGWERSSLSDYLESTCTEEMEDEHFCGMGEFYIPLQSTGATKIFDMEYKCDLVVLPNPYKKNIIMVAEEKPTPLIQTSIQSPITTTNPWKKIEKTQVDEDPWKFLEPKKPTVVVPPPAKMEKKKYVIDNTNTNKLCKYKDECRMNRNKNCTMVHSLAEWRPRVCRFNNGCRRKNLCGYYHTDFPIKDYLRMLIATKDSIYAKNSTLYEKYL